MARPRKVIPAPTFTVNYEIQSDLKLEAVMLADYMGRTVKLRIAYYTSTLHFTSWDLDQRGVRYISYNTATKTFRLSYNQMTAWTEKFLNALIAVPEMVEMLHDMATYSACVGEIRHADDYASRLASLASDLQQSQMYASLDGFAPNMAHLTDMLKNAQAMLTTPIIQKHMATLRGLRTFRKALTSDNKNTRLRAMRLIGASA